MKDGAIDRYTLVKSARRTIAIEIKRDGTVVVRAPRRAKDEEIKSFVKSKRGWIEKHLARIASAPKAEKFSLKEIAEMKAKVYSPLVFKVKFFAEKAGVSYGKVSVRAQKTLWGSCNKKGDLSFNCLLSLLPQELFDYVVVHELCHRKQMNHSAAFWREVEKILPDYKARRANLKKTAPSLIARLP